MSRILSAVRACYTWYKFSCCVNRTYLVYWFKIFSSIHKKKHLLIHISPNMNTHNPQQWNNRKTQSASKGMNLMITESKSRSYLRNVKHILTSIKWNVYVMCVDADLALTMKYFIFILKYIHITHKQFWREWENICLFC